MVRRVDRSPPVSRSLSTSASPSQRDPGGHDRLWRESPSGFCKPAYGVGDRLARPARWGLAGSPGADVDEVIAALNREEHRSFDGVTDDPAHFRKAVIMRADHAGGADDHGI